LAVAFAAFCVWLGVRVYNRRERWAKWTAVGICLVTAYVLSIGPAAWITMGSQPGERLWDAYHAFYRPVIALGAYDEGKEGDESGPLFEMLSDYLRIWGGRPIACIDI
jgi:hypothetical protein